MMNIHSKSILRDFFHNIDSAVYVFFQAQKNIFTS